MLWLEKFSWFKADRTQAKLEKKKFLEKEKTSPQFLA
jgi:hypothetical protein